MNDALTEAAEAIAWACELLRSAWARSETGCYKELCKLRDTVRFAAAYGQQSVMDGDAPPPDPDDVAEGLADRIAALEEKVTAPSKTSIALLEDLDRRLRKAEGCISETQRKMATGMRQIDTRIDDVGNRLDRMPAP